MSAAKMIAVKNATAFRNLRFSNLIKTYLPLLTCDTNPHIPVSRCLEYLQLTWLMFVTTIGVVVLARFYHRQ
jgi:hypothetical protein